MALVSKMRSFAPRIGFSNKVLRHSLIFTLTNILNSALPFCLLPIMTNFLTPSDYGLLTMFGVAVGFISTVGGLNLHGAFTQQFFRIGKFEKNRMLSTFFIATVFTTCISSFLFFPNESNPINTIAKVKGDVFLPLILICVSQNLIRLVLANIQCEEKPLLYGSIQVLTTLGGLILSVLFVVIFHFDWLGRVYAQACIGFITLVFALSYVKNKVSNFSFSKLCLRSGFSYGIPLMPYSMSAFISSSLDRFVISNFGTLALTGVYSAAYQVSMVVGIVEASFNQALVPWLYRKLAERDRGYKYTIVYATYAYLAFLVFLSLAAAISIPLVIAVFLGDQFQDAKIYVPWLISGFAANGGAKAFGNLLFFHEKTGVLSYITFFSLIVNAALNIFLFKRVGVIGAAQAFALTNLLTLLATWCVSQKFAPMPWIGALFRRHAT